MVRTVVTRAKLRLANGQADRIGHALAERAGRYFDTRRVTAFGMSRRLAAPLAELPNVIEAQIETGQMQEAVKQRRAVPGRKHEAIAIGPAWIARVVFEKARPQHVGHRRCAERQTGMAT